MKTAKTCKEENCSTAIPFLSLPTSVVSWRVGVSTGGHLLANSLWLFPAPVGQLTMTLSGTCWPTHYDSFRHLLANSLWLFPAPVGQLTTTVSGMVGVKLVATCWPTHDDCFRHGRCETGGHLLANSRRLFPAWSVWNWWPPVGQLTTTVSGMVGVKLVATCWHTLRLLWLQLCQQCLVAQFKFVSENSIIWQNLFSRISAIDSSIIVTDILLSTYTWIFGQSQHR